MHIKLDETFPNFESPSKTKTFFEMLNIALDIANDAQFSFNSTYYTIAEVHYKMSVAAWKVCCHYTNLTEKS